MNWLAFWSHEDIEISITQGIDEIALALFAYAYSRTYRSSVYARSATAEPITTRRGLVVYPNHFSGQKVAGRLVELPTKLPAAAALDAALLAIEQSYGIATANFVSLQIEYLRSKASFGDIR